MSGARDVTAVTISGAQEEVETLVVVAVQTPRRHLHDGGDPPTASSIEEGHRRDERWTRTSRLMVHRLAIGMAVVAKLDLPLCRVPRRRIVPDRSLREVVDRTNVAPGHTEDMQVNLDLGREIGNTRTAEEVVM